jgi:hypothetical protein
VSQLRVPLELVERANAVFNWGPAPTAKKPARAATRAKVAAAAKATARRADLGDQATDVVLAEVPEEAL